MKRVMIVDDNEIGLRCLGRILGKHFEVATAEDGQQALAKLEAFQPNLVITDFSMPGISGLKLLEEVKRRLPECARMLLSGSIEPTNGGEVATYHLTKPWKNDELLAQLSQILA